MAGKAKKQKIGHAKVEIIITDVENPWHDAGKAESLGNPKFIKAAINMRESPAAHWYHKNQIDLAEYRAATRFRSIWEKAGGTGAQAMDYTREKVDGGGFREPISLVRMQAGRDLNEARDCIGVDGFVLVQKLCGECLPMNQVFSSSWEQRKKADTCRQMLTRLAELWGYKNRPIRAVRTG